MSPSGQRGARTPQESDELEESTDGVGSTWAEKVPAGGGAATVLARFLLPS
jgi:hypothetical protein